MQLLKYTITLIFISVNSFANAQFTKLMDFNDAETGCDPYMVALVGDGTWLYGTANSCGANNRGTIYKIKPDGSDFTVIYDFNESEGGNTPESGVIYDGTYLYGHTRSGGINEFGTLYKIKPDGSDYQVLRDFLAGDADGGVPYGTLHFDGTYIYGTCSQAGLYFGGTLFKIKPDGSEYEILHHFGFEDTGKKVYGGVISDGTYLSGMTVEGGTDNIGVAYKIKTDGSDYSEFINFTDDPNGGLAYGAFVSDGNYLYAATSNGGEANRGIIYRVKPDGSDFLVLHSFELEDGAHPFGSLIIVDDKLYGLTEFAGTYNGGTLFELEKDGSNYTVLLHFDEPTDGSLPFSTLFYDHGAIFGVTNKGGVNGQGVIFRWGDIVSDITELSTTNLKIYPNPTSGNINFELDAKLFSSEIQIQIIDMHGKIIQQTTAQPGINTVNLENFAEGLYVIRMQNGLEIYSETILVQGN